MGILGLAAGGVARMFVFGSRAGWLVVVSMLGVSGAVVRGFTGTQLGFGEVDGVEILGFVIAIGAP
ncbi:MAG: GlsB/YeaQ/YmgE family stress response membrane protein [Rhodopirellula sp.]|nr:GlsB/YeaQ/YmgE family stress response membrane protein [Rhodopirellula sp.]